MNSLLMITHSSKPVGGGESDFLKLLNEYSKKYQLLLVFPFGDDNSIFKKYSNIFAEIPDCIFPFTGINIKKYFFFFYSCISKYIILSQFLRDNRHSIDVAFVNSSVNLFEVIMLNLFKIPYFISIKEVIMPRFVRRLIYNYYAKTSEKIILISKSLMDDFALLTKSDKCILIHSSVDKSEYEEYAAKSVPLPDPDKQSFKIVNVGGIHPLKNQELLLDAVQRINSEKLIEINFVGRVLDNSYRNKLIKKTKDINGENINVNFIDEINKERLFLKILESDVVSITSRSEGMSLVIVEALLAGKPLITTNVGIVPEIIEHGINGLIVNTLSADEYAENLYELLNNDSLYELISRNSVKCVNKCFDISNFLNQHSLVLETVLKSIKSER